MFFKLNISALSAIILAIFASGTNGYINITSILERADDPCDLNQDRDVGSGIYDVEIGRNILDNLVYASSDLYSHYQQLFGCNNMDALQAVKEGMNLPAFPDSSTLPTDVKSYYIWLLWAQEAEIYMSNSSIMRNPSFDLWKLNETANLMMQLACLMFDSNLEANVNLPPFMQYTDPIEFRIRSCVLFEAVPNFANAALSLTFGRGRRSSHRRHHQRPYKALELSPTQLHYQKDIKTTTQSMVPVQDSLIAVWTHIKVDTNRKHMNKPRGATSKINGKTRKLLVNLKIKQN